MMLNLRKGFYDDHHAAAVIHKTLPRTPVHTSWLQLDDDVTGSKIPATPSSSSPTSRSHSASSTSASSSRPGYSKFSGLSLSLAIGDAEDAPEDQNSQPEEVHVDALQGSSTPSDERQSLSASLNFTSHLDILDSLSPTPLLPRKRPRTVSVSSPDDQVDDEGDGAAPSLSSAELICKDRPSKRSRSSKDSSVSSSSIFSAERLSGDSHSAVVSVAPYAS